MSISRVSNNQSIKTVARHLGHSEIEVISRKQKYGEVKTISRVGKTFSLVLIRVHPSGTSLLANNEFRE